MSHRNSREDNFGVASPVLYSPISGGTLVRAFNSTVSLFRGKADQQSAESAHINEMVRHAWGDIEDVARMHGTADTIANGFAVHLAIGLSRSCPSRHDPEICRTVLVGQRRVVGEHDTDIRAGAERRVEQSRVCDLFRFIILPSVLDVVDCPKGGFVGRCVGNPRLRASAASLGFRSSDSSLAGGALRILNRIEANQERTESARVDEMVWHAWRHVQNVAWNAPLDGRRYGSP